MKICSGYFKIDVISVLGTTFSSQISPLRKIAKNQDFFSFNLLP